MVQKGVGLTNGLHGVPLLYEQLGSGDVDVHAQRLLLFVDWFSWTRVLTEEHKPKNNLLLLVTSQYLTKVNFVKTANIYLISISAKLLASVKSNRHF